MATVLDSIVSQSSQESPELPRLTAANVFIHYARMGLAIDRLGASYRRLPDATQQGLTDELKQIMKEADSIAKYAARLVEANR